MRLPHLEKDDPEIAALAAKEAERIETTLDLIAAENHAPLSVLEALGSIFNTKTIEGYPGGRYHAGCRYADAVEDLAIERARGLFGAPYVNVQPHSGTSANLAVYFALLKVGDRILSMSLPHGGHLSHGHAASITSRCFEFRHYTVDSQTERIDYDQVRDLAKRFAPRMIVAGASAYPRLIDYATMAAIAREVSALLLVDMAHLGGLVAGGAIPSPVPHADAVTLTCYKTMMGGRGGVILAQDAFGDQINRAVFPGCQGTSPVSTMAAKAVIFRLAQTEWYAAMQRRTVQNARHLVDGLVQKGYRLVTGGTDNHQVIIDLGGRRLNGTQAESLLESAGIVTNRNVVARDAAQPGRVSGVRLGTGAVTARGMGAAEMGQITLLIDGVLSGPGDRAALERVRLAVRDLCGRFPVYAAG